jgi:hypothetical protein
LTSLGIVLYRHLFLGKKRPDIRTNPLLEALPMPERILDLVLNSPVAATDGPVGRVEHVIIDPGHGRASHVVVRESHLPNALRLVPEKFVA